MKDIPLDHQERKKKVNWLKGIPFERFEVHRHYFKASGEPRHGITVVNAKKIYYQFDKIIDIFKRPGKKGFKYCFVYKLNNRSGYYLILLLDEKPMKLFNAYYVGRNVEARLRKKFGFRG